MAGGSQLILSTRGTFYRADITDDSSPGMYAVDELNRYMRTRMDSEADGSPQTPVLLTTIEFSQTDITSEMPCLNNVKVFYTFGQNFGQVQIGGEILLGPIGAIQRHNAGFRLIKDFFYEYRVSRYRLPIAVSIANESYYVYLKGLKVGAIDPNFHVMGFVLFGTLLDIGREDYNLVNPRSLVVTTENIDSSALISALRASKPQDLTIIQAQQAAAAAQTKSTVTDNTGKTPVAIPTMSLADYQKLGNASKIQAASTLIARTESQNKPITDDMLRFQDKGRQIDEVKSNYRGNSGAALDDKVKEDYNTKVSSLMEEQAAIGERIVIAENSSTPAPLKDRTATGAVTADTTQLARDQGTLSINPNATYKDPADTSTPYVTQAWPSGVSPVLSADEVRASQANTLSINPNVTYKERTDVYMPTEAQSIRQAMELPPSGVSPVLSTNNPNASINADRSRAYEK